RECAFPVRCGWSAARLPECAPSLTAFVAGHESAIGTKRTCTLPEKPGQNSIFLPAPIVPRYQSSCWTNGPRSPHPLAAVATSVLPLGMSPLGGRYVERNDNCCSRIRTSRRAHRAKRREIRRGKKSLQRHDRPEAAADCALR